MRYIILFVIVVVVLSCTKEDANLVNPPPPYQSIRIRLLNTVNSSDLISWGQKGNEISDKVGYLQISNPVMPPPIDSFAVEFFSKWSAEIYYASENQVCSRNEISLCCSREL